jgi:hypothetical protein
MRLIHHFRPFLELGSCKEYVMAQKTTESGKRRSKKAASVQSPPPAETRREAAPTGKVPVRNLEEEIRRRAYELYLQRGGTPGNPSQDWLVAEQEVRSRQMEQLG